MHYFLYPDKDAFITNQPNLMLKNTGLDEILEVEKTIQPKSCGGGSGSVVSRTLMQFDIGDISASISSGKITNPTFTLNLRCSEAHEIPLGYSIYAFPISSSWVMGTGYKFDGQSSADGVSWKFADGSSIKWWSSSSLMDCSGGGVWLTDVGVPGSGSIVAHTTGNLVESRTFNYETSDVKMPINNIMSAWMSGSIPNNGLILLNGGESDSLNYGKLRFFSRETNTIYRPYIDVAWDDSVINTGSLDGSGSLNPVDITDAVMSLPGLKKEYKSENFVRVNVFGRQKYPQKTFTNRLSDYLEPMYFPTNSFYSIKDAESEMSVLPFDEFTRLSCDGRGNYFIMDTSGLPQERYYKVEIRCEQGENIVTFTSPLTFKITR